MRVHIGSLKGKRGASLPVAFTVDTVPGITDAPGVRIQSPVSVTGTVTNTGRCFLVRGTVTATAELECSRCLDTFTQALTVPLEEEYFPAADGTRKGNGTDDPEGLFAAESVFTGDIIDLTEAVRETIMLAIPYRPLCRDECPGLCPVCGKRLAAGACHCERTESDPRLAGLARLLQNERNHES